MPEHGCRFCSAPNEAWFHSAPLVRALWDRHGVAPGHALIIPRRHIASWSDATPAERIALFDAVDAVRPIIDQKHSPDGYNLGLNIGTAAQTVNHLHLHVIPRYAGDFPDRRGGVRRLLAARGNYLLTPTIEGAPHDRTVIRGSDDPLLP